MTYLFKLSLDHPDIGRAEIVSLLKAKIAEQNKEYVVVNMSLQKANKKKTNNCIKLSQRLAYVHSIYEILFISSKKALEKKLNSHKWNFKGSFALRYENQSLQRKFADIIYISAKKRTNKFPKVDLKNPKNLIEIIKIKNRYFVTKHLFDTDKSYLKRAGHLRPKNHPTTLDPKLARACINLTGLNKGTILDPFCGSGGILLEAGFLNFNSIGYDLDENILFKAKENLKFYKTQNCVLINKDALKISKNDLRKIDAIVTDPPYGKGSKLFKQNIDNLYSEFLNNLNLKRNSRLVMIFPNFSNLSFLKSVKTKYKVINKFNFYIHRSLTRFIYVLSAQ